MGNSTAVLQQEADVPFVHPESLDGVWEMSGLQQDNKNQ